MGSEVALPFGDRDRPNVAAAAVRVEALWPDASVAVGSDGVVLTSGGLDVRRLTQIWTCALLNERLVVEGTEVRARVLSKLLA